jgi:hypothetical protein
MKEEKKNPTGFGFVAKKKERAAGDGNRAPPRRTAADY